MKSESAKKKISFKKEPSDEASSSKKSRKRKESTSEESGSSSSEAQRSNSEDVKKPIVQEASRRQEASASENVQDFMQKHPSMSLTTPTMENPDVKVYAEEEVFILQCHNSINPEKLLGKKIALMGATEIQEDGVQFSVDKFPEKASKTVTLVSSQETGSLKAETFPVVGRILLSHIIEEHDISYDFTQDNAHEEFPKDLRVRHPLLGVNFEEKLAEIASVPIKEESPEVETPRKSKKRIREADSSPEKRPPAKRIKQEEISSDLQWIQNV